MFGRSVERLSFNKRDKRSCFPDNPTYTGFMQIMSGNNPPYKRQYFCLKNNFLLSAASLNSVEEERAICLEGVDILKPAEYTDARYCFLIECYKKTYYLKCSTTEERKVWVRHIKRASELKLKDIWRKTGPTLGRSVNGNSKVIPAVHRETGQRVAIKIINKNLCNLDDLHTEVQALKKIKKHECVVELYDIFETRKYLHLIMELCDGGELLHRMTQRGGQVYNERECCKIMNMVARGVKHIHSHGIVHRDLKPANILCKDNSSMSIRVADFGISKVLEGQEKYMRSKKGTLKYIAPEILKGDLYDMRVDHWSIGIIMYRLFSGTLPFQGEGEAQLIRSILEDDVNLDTKGWAHVSPQAKNLIKRLLSRNPARRATLDDILEFTSKSKSNKKWIKRNRRSRSFQRESIMKIYDIKEDIGEQEVCLTPTIVHNRLNPSIRGDDMEKFVKEVAAMKERRSRKKRSPYLDLTKISLSRTPSPEIIKYKHSQSRKTRKSSDFLTRSDKKNRIGTQYIAPRDFFTRPDKKVQKGNHYLSPPSVFLGDVGMVSPKLHLGDLKSNEDYNRTFTTGSEASLILLSESSPASDHRDSVIVMYREQPSPSTSNYEDSSSASKLLLRLATNTSKHFPTKHFPTKHFPSSLPDGLKLRIKIPNTPKPACICFRQPIEKDEYQPMLFQYSPQKPDS